MLKSTITGKKTKPIPVPSSSHNATSIKASINFNPERRFDHVTITLPDDGCDAVSVQVYQKQQRKHTLILPITDSKTAKTIDLTKQSRKKAVMSITDKIKGMFLFYFIFLNYWENFHRIEKR